MPEGTTRGTITFATNDPESVDLDDLKSAARLGRAAFGGDAIPLVDRLLDDLAQSDDFYYDTVSQIRMDVWHKSRIAVVGDSAFAPSFKTGQGSSLAFIGAYVMASELAANPNPEEAFAAYHAKLKDFVDSTQALALQPGSFVLPLTSKELRARNLKLRLIPLIQRLGLIKLMRKRLSDVTNSLDVDGYGLTAPTQRHNSRS